MRTDNPRPVWLMEPCPRWCDGDHARQELPADRRHQCVLAEVPVIFRRADDPSGSAPTAVVIADDLGIVIFREVGSAGTWVALAGDAEEMIFRLESVGRLSAVLSRVLAGILR